MGISLRILVPDSTTNYIQNPSLGVATTGWYSSGATITRTLDRARFGIASLKIVTNGSTIREGAYYRVNNLSGISENLCASIYVRGTGRVRIRLIDNPRGKEFVSDTVTLNDSRWQRIEVSGFCTGSNDVRLYVETDGNSSRAVTFYADGAQLERKIEATTYCDGDQPGCRWNLISHSSLSTRNSYTRAGGKWIQLAGCQRDEQDLYFTVVGGLGFAPISNNIQSYGETPGAYYQNTKINTRVVTFTFHAKNKSNLFPVAMSKLHELRQYLIDLVKPDKTSGGEEFTFEYKNGDTVLYFKARYDGGLEGEWDVRNQWINSFPLRVVCTSPFLYEDDQEVASLSFLNSSTMRQIVGRVNEEWSNMNYGVGPASTAYITCMAVGKSGEIYIGGSFSQVNFNANAVDPLLTCNSIAKWNGISFERVGNGAISSGGVVYVIAVAPNGDIYAGGAFTSIGGVAANYIAKWDGSTWSALGTGVNNTVYAIKISPSGQIYIGGAFTQAGGVVRNYLARWDGSSWQTVGAAPFINNTVYSLAMSVDGAYLYIGGSFTTPATRILTCNISTNAFTTELSVGDFDDTVYALNVSRDGYLYAGGPFLQPYSRITVWNGTTWLSVGSGITGTTVKSIAISNDLLILTGGTITALSGIYARNITLFKGSSWFSSDLFLSNASSTSPTVEAVLFHPNGDVYAGGRSFDLTQTIYSATTLVSNTGTCQASPVIYISGPGMFRQIENQTSGKVVYFNLQIFSGEEVIIDFGKGTVKSSVRGDLTQFILAGSDFANFFLLPGENKISAFMHDEVGAKMYINYIPTHWSADATEVD